MAKPSSTQLVLIIFLSSHVLVIDASLTENGCGSRRHLRKNENCLHVAGLFLLSFVNGVSALWVKVLDDTSLKPDTIFARFFSKHFQDSGFWLFSSFPGKKHHCYCRCWRLWDESDIRYSSIFRILVAAWVWISFGWSRLWNPSQKRRQTNRCRPMTTLGPVELFCCQSIWSVAVPCHFTLSPEKMQDPTMLAEAMPRHHCLKLPSFRLPAAYGDHGLIWAKEQKHHTTNTTA